MADTDAIIRRQIWLLQFANSFGERIIDEFKPNDRKLRSYLRDWLDDASDRDLSALLRADRRNNLVGDLFRQLRALRDDQLKRIETFVVTELEALIVSEGRALSKALDGTYKPRPAEVLNQPILGVKPRDQVKADVRWWYDMTLAQVVDAVQSDANAVQTIFGSRGQPSGSLMNSRNLKIERNAETQIVGVAANTRRVVYVSAGVDKEEYLGTLDHRTCLVCASLDGNVYKLGEGAHPPMHPRCRCLRIVHLEEQPTPRPFVEDDRPVRNIPIDEREGKIGRTVSRYPEFFERQTEAAKRRILGPERYRLYREGASITEFVNDRTLTIKTIDELDRAA